MPYITKQYQFCAAHRYWNIDWTEEENKNIFGKDIYVHGHNYLLDITISGPIDKGSGFIINLKTLNELVDQKVINVLDHSQIEKDINWFEKMAPNLPKDAVKVAESGIKTSADLDFISQFGYTVALIGTSLMKSKSPGKSLKKLLKETVK